MSQKLLLLDLDGTIREPKSKAKFINDPEDQQPIQGAVESVQSYFSKGWLVCGISNQAGIAAGYMTVEACAQGMAKTMTFFPDLIGILFCPDFEGSTVLSITSPTAPPWGYGDARHEQLKGTYRKPGPGMLLVAMEWLAVEPADCLMVGDRPEDQEAAAAAGVSFSWAADWLRNP